MHTTAPGLTAARAINAHPWLTGHYPTHEDTSIRIQMPFPGEYREEPTGRLEGRISWEMDGPRFVDYHITLTYQGPRGTVRDETTVWVDPASPMAWLNLARPIAALVIQLERLAHETADA